MTTIRTIARRDDGSLIGEDGEGALYRGVESKVGHDALKFDVTVSEDGRTIDQTFTHQGQVVGHGTLNRDAFVEDRAWVIARELVKRGSEQEDAFSEATLRAEAEWDGMKKAPKTLKPTLNQATGEPVFVTVVDWEAL